MSLYDEDSTGGAEPSGKWAGVFSNLWTAISNSKPIVAATVLEQTPGKQGAVGPALGRLSAAHR